jgi:hypothetical protein
MSAAGAVCTRGPGSSASWSVCWRRGADPQVTGNRRRGLSPSLPLLDPFTHSEAAKNQSAAAVATCSYEEELLDWKSMKGWRSSGQASDSFYQVRPDCTHNVPNTKFKIKVRSPSLQFRIRVGSTDLRSLLSGRENTQCSEMARRIHA